ncbi:hypothetical protein PICMEDRAFT_13191 [Pichia membranifaciens NRRL Y-2026]|uniref:RING-type domain-containing protein n=1 Tax=Pichia membranifaciens NRRL Y-2026 TaxID=763406 RepID=A0A1E3NH41_9ASCO|nr:hypothetical protein PICMEDRAFT_13191 [Pichia membranifaciens NRRL Y-2026]ODQ45475.1 hypothetical protein PICMEDRAFT_13191 [Pichia membranifaciens NRRL Y-2026]
MPVSFVLLAKDIRYENLPLLLDSRSPAVEAASGEDEIELVSYRSEISLKHPKILDDGEYAQVEGMFAGSNTVRISHDVAVKAKKPSQAADGILLQFQQRTLKPLLVLSFRPEYRQLVLLIHFFLHQTKLRSTPYVRTVPFHLRNVELTLDRTTRTFNIRFSLCFSISVRESIYAFLPPDTLSSLNRMAELLFIPRPTAYQVSFNSFSAAPSVSSFYSLITDHTRRAHTLETQMLNLPGVYKTLMPFQVDSLKWMLSHEGVELASCDGGIKTRGKPFPRDANDETTSEILDTIIPGWTRLSSYADQSKLYWYNPYNGSLCTSAFVKKYLESIHFVRPPAKGFLCEEMGLGKTLEITTLIKANPRVLVDGGLKSDLLEPSRKIKQSKTTLIVCPETILNQWYGEITSICSDLTVNMYKGVSLLEEYDDSLTPTMIANELSSYDIVLTSYNTLARELSRAIFIPTSRPKRKTSSYDRIDYSSPLMLLEFYRLVLDEAQLASISISKVAHFSRIIPRIHTWCVSGTLIRKNLEDLHSLIMSQRLNPLDNLNIQQWNQLPRHFFDRLFSRVCLRHTKEMVGSQVRLPKQHRIMLRSPFSTIESDNYHDLFNRFLEQVGLNDNGEPIAEGFDLERSRMGMSVWCNKLRMACCHALLNGSQIRRNMALDNAAGGNTKSAKGKNKNDADLIIGTLSDVLSDLVNSNEAESHNCFFSYAKNYIKMGKIHEFLRDPAKSIEVFLSVIDVVREKLSCYQRYYDSEATSDRRKNWTVRIRNLLEFLHQSYFMLASAHYQHYRPMKPLPKSFRDLNESVLDEKKEEKAEDVEVVDVETLSEEEKKHYHLENEYYAKADEILNQLLEEPLKKTNEMITKLGKTFSKFSVYKVKEIPTIKPIEEDETFSVEIKPEKHEEYELPLICEYFEDLTSDMKNHATSLEVSFVLNRSQEAMEQLNEQSTIINFWFKKLIEYQKIPVVKNDETDKTGEEYGLSLISQEESQAYIDQLQLILDDREKAINSTEDTLAYKSNNFKMQRIFNDSISSKSPLSLELEKLRKYYIPQGTLNPRYSYRTAILELVGELQSYTLDSYKHIQLSGLIAMLKAEMTKQMKNVKHMRVKLFDVLNDAFNSKVSYFKALQVRSDTLVNFTPEKIGDSPQYSALVELETVKKELAKDDSKLRSLNARLNYLRSLNSKRQTEGNQGENDNLKEDSCVICRYRILVGTLTPCGHKYCRECLTEWMKTKKVCPLCQKKLRVDELYNFTYSRGGLKGDVVESLHDHKEEVAPVEDKENENHLAKGESVKNEDSTLNEEENLADDDLDRLKLLQNRRLFEKDMDFVYQGLPTAQLREISNIGLKRNYGTKVDMIIRQAKYLVTKDPSVQILVFSQWNAFLLLLGRAMNYEGVKFKSWMNQKAAVSNETGMGRTSRKNNSSNSKLNQDITDFKRDPSITCFLLNTIAQAAGLTFTNASHVFLCEPMINLSFELQAVNRIHRIGQTKETSVWNFIIEGTIEESIAYLGTKKRIQAAKVRKSVMNTEQEERNEVAESADEIDDDVLEAKELTKVNDTSRKDGEVIPDDDLWAAFFAARSVKVIGSVYTDN